MILLVLLAALTAPIVEGRVGEPSGAGTPGAQVTLVQGNQTQVRLTGADGSFRFRAFAGPGTISVVLPQGWTLDGPGSAPVDARPGRTAQAAFRARARRVLRGRLLIGGAPVGPVDLAAGGVPSHADAMGDFVADGVPGGRIAVQLDLLSGTVEVPAGPGVFARDVALAPPALADLRLARLPQPPAVRSIAAWIAELPLSDVESGEIERLAALVNLNAAFRLVMVARPADAGLALRAAVVLERYLAGPFLVPRDRLAFAVGEVAPGGRLALVLMRREGE